MKKFLRIMCLVLALVMVMASFAGCVKPVDPNPDDPNPTPNPGGDKTQPDALVVMIDAVDGLFNPFYATSGADMSVVGMTQLSMLSTGYDGEEASVACGEDESCVVLDYKSEFDKNAGEEGQTTYTFVLKNGIKFSDGHPLTMEDVLFNMYVYLDPVYTGSTTMYSTDIVGLDAYRTQKNTSGDSSSSLDSTAYGMANDRILELINLFNDNIENDADKALDQDEMKDLIANASLSDGYKEAIAVDGVGVTNANLLADYEKICAEFLEELGDDYDYAKEAYTEEPYLSQNFDEITSFMYVEGYVDVEFGKKGTAGNETIDNSVIEKVTRNYNQDTIKTMEDAINYVYGDKISRELSTIMTYYNTSRVVLADFAAKAKEVLLDSLVGEDGLKFANISGIKSLGHTADADGEVLIDGKSYTVATQYNEDGTVKNDSEFAVLEIKINGIDPKAIWNFGFTVAPQHYYAEGYDVDIANNEFGVEWGSYDYMSNVIQKYNKVPMGAGVYMATDAKNNTNPDGNAFNNSNVIYYKANEHFLMGEAKIEKFRYQVISSSNAIAALQSGSIHYVVPQFTSANVKTLKDLEAKGIETLDSWQLGYGYIGVSAANVPDLNLRKAIMSAMDTSMALAYYSVGTAKTIAWPMSTVSWAYPKDSTGALNTDNGHDYTTWTTEADALTKIKGYMAAANVAAGDSKLKITFTIAGSNLTDHPTYSVFRKAAEMLNDCGWNVEVIPDVNALNKLSTGALSVWAAAWGSTIDPDMYQVYHKGSTATSTKAWGYDAFKSNPSMYVAENRTLNNLSEVIDLARETDDQGDRTELYEEAMGYVLDLAVEMPVYQRKELYAYNSNVIDSNSLPSEINPYTSPLDKIWEIEFAK